jgi:signal transduction histidine kinase
VTVVASEPDPDPDLLIDALHHTVLDLVADVPLGATLSMLAEHVGRHSGRPAPTVHPFVNVPDGSLPTSPEPRASPHPIVDLDGRTVGTIDLGDDPPPIDDVVRRLIDVMGLVIGRHAIRRRRLAQVGFERERIASQLHDDPVQAMAAVGLILQRIQLHHDDPELRRDLDDARRQVVEAAQRVRHMMFALHPPTLSEAGLAGSLADYLEAFVGPDGPACSIDADGEIDLPLELAALAFRLTRGAIHNAVQHADATRLDVHLVIVDDILRISVTDDGVGFDVDAASTPHPGHAGIPYARELVAEYGGSYEIDSRPGRTVVTVSIPIH